MDLESSTFGKYFLTEKIATGGMAEIFLAKLIGPDGFEKFLVIKKIHPELSGKRQFVKLFVDEAKTLVSLTHGNIVPIYELGVVDSTYFIAMEYIDGPTLLALSKALKKRGQAWAPTMAAYICAELLKGLDYAHRKGEGVIHRDLSPRNVMISREGEVKLVDFGIAAPNDQSSKILAGSYPYMSPEQANGQPLDARSDLFAVGILLWEMLTGEALFLRENETATLEAVRTHKVALASSLRPDAAGVLDAICERALQRDRDSRYQTAGDFLVALLRYLYSQAETVSPKDISRVVAQTCPAIPTSDDLVRPRTANTGPHTAVMKRDSTMATAKGKARNETVRSFATSVRLEEVLSGTPILGVRAVATTPMASRPAERVPSDARVPAAPKKRERATSAALHRDSGPWRLKVALAALLFCTIGVVVFTWQGKEAQTPLSTAGSRISDADSDDGTAALPLDAQVPEGKVAAADAAVPAADARKRQKRRPIPQKAAPPPGTLRIGANPWGDVYVDGQKAGRAPGSFRLSPGEHIIEVRYQGQRKKFDVTVTSGQLTSLGLVDFSASSQAPPAQ